MDDNKRNFDDFFDSGREPNSDKPAADHSDSDSGQAAGPKAEKSDGARPYYYSYGPFRAGMQGERTDERLNTTSTGQDGVTRSVEVTRPDPVKPFSVGPYHSGASGGGSWQYSSKPKRSSFTKVFISFMAGVVVMGSLMFASDRMNLFTPDHTALATPGTSDPAPQAQTVSNTTDVVRPNNIAKIFEQSSPAVVKIETYSKSRGQQRSSLFDDPFFRQFFGDENDNGDGGDQGGQPVLSGLGSGFIFEASGYILTNQHVVGDADDIRVTLEGHKEPYKAKLLGSSYDLDLAVIKIEGDDFPTLKLGKSADMNIGDWVVAIGNPNGFDHTVTVGVLSAKERKIEIPDQQNVRRYQHLLQTDASINPGNSGGPLLNLQGEVIGINTAVSAQSQGIGFAIPTSTIDAVLDSLKNNVAIPKPFIGANLAVITDQAAKELGLDDTNGALVADVLFNAPAYHAELRKYDAIIGIDGKKYATREQLIDHIGTLNIGDEITLNIVRNGKKMDVIVKIGDRNEYEKSVKPNP